MEESRVAGLEAETMSKITYRVEYLDKDGNGFDKNTPWVDDNFDTTRVDAAVDKREYLINNLGCVNVVVIETTVTERIIQ